MWILMIGMSAMAMDFDKAIQQQEKVNEQIVKTFTCKKKICKLKTDDDLTVEIITIRGGKSK